jgi:NADPH:quinone reductase-like Zn-dependent oxidoreductase
MQNYLLYTLEILLGLVAPLLILFLKGSWPLRKVTLALMAIPVLWYFTYAPIHELSHAAGVYLAGGTVIEYKLIPRFWMGEFAGAWIKADGISRGWQQITMTAFPYLLDIVCFVVALVVLRRSSSRNPFWIGLAFMLLCLRPAMDFVFEPVAFFTGDRNDFYALQQIVGPFAIRAFILISIGLAVYSVSSTLVHLVRLQNNRLGKIPMKAVVYTKFGPPEMLHLQDVEKPTPKANEVLIKILAATVAKEDPDMRSAPGANGLLKPSHQILGQELAGVVEAVGKNVTRFRPGDPVFGMEFFGACAQYKCMPEDGALTLKPANISFEEAASIPNGALTALPFLRDKAMLRAGQSVLIYGASGSVGSAAVQLARYYGAEVTGVCGPANLGWVQVLGAAQVIDYTREDFTQNGKTYDVIFDTVGKLSFFACEASLAHAGVYLSTVPTPAIMLRALWPAANGVKKVKFLAAGLRPAREKMKDLVFLSRLVEAGKFKPVIDRRYPMQQIAAAHRYVAQGHKKGNVVITVDQPTQG